MLKTYEVFLKHASLDNVAWHEFLCTVSNYFKKPTHWQIRLICQNQTLHYYLVSQVDLPVSLGLMDFLLKPVEGIELDISTSKNRGLYNNNYTDNFATITQDLMRRQYQVKSATINLYGWKSILTGRICIYYQCANHQFSKQLLLFAPAKFLSLDFTKYKSFTYKKFPKYLKLDKAYKLFQASSDQAILAVDTFPYSDQTLYLRHQDYSFAKHSLVIGSSGSGKSKFLASFIDKIYRADSAHYKVVVIDPHDALYQDCTNVASRTVLNFQDLDGGIDLFQCEISDINAGVELMLTLFHSLINDSYNGRLERVLRYTAYLLIVARQFSFLTLRQLLLDLEYRNKVLSRYQAQLPTSVAHFFLTDFNELKSQSYNDAIAPIVAFIDEMQMVPVFNSEHKLPNLAHTVQANFLSIFSLNRLKLGNKVTQTIAGLLMQQLFLLAEQKLDQHLIIIIDEISVVENPILARFLAEMRKYNTSVILAGQYFDQINANLRSAIFANVANYYLFRTSRRDAELLTANLKIKVEGSNDPEDALGLLTGLKQRECLVQASTDQEILPIFKARTTDFVTHSGAPLPTNAALSPIDARPPSSAPTLPPPKISPAPTNLLEQPFDFTNLQKFSPTLSPPKPPQNPVNLNNKFYSDENITDFIKIFSTSRKIKPGENK